MQGEYSRNGFDRLSTIAASDSKVAWGALAFAFLAVALSVAFVVAYFRFRYHPSLSQCVQVGGIAVVGPLALDDHAVFVCDFDIKKTCYEFLGAWHCPVIRKSGLLGWEYHKILLPLVVPPLRVLITKRQILALFLGFELIYFPFRIWKNSKYG